METGEKTEDSMKKAGRHINFLSSSAGFLGGVLGSYISITNLYTAYYWAIIGSVIAVIILQTVHEAPRITVAHQTRQWFFDQSVATIRSSAMLKLISSKLPMVLSSYSNAMTSHSLPTSTELKPYHSCGAQHRSYI
jgi:hypothetical protein